MKVVGMEALVRWNHPSKGVLKKSALLAELSDFKESIHLRRWILQEVCRQFSYWKRCNIAMHSIGLHVDILGCSFESTNFFKFIKEVLEQTDIQPHQLYLNLTKNVFQQGLLEYDLCYCLCSELGVNLTIDDVEINMLNLNFFFNYPFIPVSMVKIKKQVLDSILNKPAMHESFYTFIKIFSKLGISVLARGLKNKEQLALLKKLNCRYVQGSYFCKLLQGEEVGDWMKKQILLENS